MLQVGTNLGVDQERVVASVPGDVDEARRLPVRKPGRDPSEAVRADAVPPADLGVAAVRIDERDELGIGDLAAPAVLDGCIVHPSIFADRTAA